MESIKTKKLLEKGRFEEVIEGFLKEYLTLDEDNVEGKQNRKETIITELKILGEGFPGDFGPILIQIADKYKPSFKIEVADEEKIDEEHIEKQAEIYRSLVKIICTIAEKNPKKFVTIIPILIKKLAEQDIYDICSKTIENIQQKVPEEMLNVLAKSLKKQKDEDFRWRFTLQLGKLGTKFPELIKDIIPLLKERLEDSDERVRAAATEAISLVGIESPEDTTNVIPIEEIKEKAEDESAIVQDITKEMVPTLEKVVEAEELIHGLGESLAIEEKTEEPRKSVIKPKEKESKPKRVAKKKKGKKTRKMKKKK
ncbi:MAG: sister chromatid cohesion protein PDS5 [Candidatus Helarchaeota archaeon]